MITDKTTYMAYKYLFLMQVCNITFLTMMLIGLIIGKLVFG